MKQTPRRTHPAPGRRGRWSRWARALAVAPAVLCVAAASGCGLVRDGGDRRDPPTPVVSVPAGTSTHTLTVDGRRRTFRLYRPATVTTGPVPLVVMVHGALGTGEQAESSYGWNAEADRGRFVVAYPDGVNRSWAVGPDCCGPPARDGVDDVAFIRQVVESVAGLVPLDRRRVYATGISNGGMLTYRLACDTTIFAAIGPVAATQLGPCPDPAPVSVIHIHGTADRTVPYGGGPGRLDNGGTGRSPVRLDGPPTPELIARWRAVANCAPPTTSTTGAVTTSTAVCPEGRAVELVTVAGAGHQWPGAPGPGPHARRLPDLDPPARAPDATATIWRFFAAHPAAGS